MTLTSSLVIYIELKKNKLCYFKVSYTTCFSKVLIKALFSIKTHLSHLTYKKESSEMSYFAKRKPHAVLTPYPAYQSIVQTGKTYLLRGLSHNIFPQ